MKRGWILLSVVIVLALVPLIPTMALIAYSFLAFDFLLAISSFWWILGPIIFFLVSIAIVYFFLAPNNLFFTFVPEGTAKFIVAGKKFVKCLMEWEGRRFYGDPTKGIERWNIVSGEKSLFRRFFAWLLGGARFYGFWPLRDVHVYKFKWTGVAEDGTKKPKEEWLDHILLQDYVYYAEIMRAEDKNLLPLKVELFLTIRIINPYKARFIVRGWLNALINRMQAPIREYVATKTYEDLSELMKTVGDEMLEKLKDTDLTGTSGEFYTRYGIDLRAVEVRQIDPPEEWRNLTLAPYKAEMEGQARVIQATKESEAIIKLAEAAAKEIDLTFTEAVKRGVHGVIMFMATKTTGKDLAGLANVLILPQFMRTFGESAEVTVDDIRSLVETLRGSGVGEETINKLLAAWDKHREVLDKLTRR